MRRLLACLLAPWSLLAPGSLRAQLVLEGSEGALAGKHVVFLTGDEEYRSEEGMPMLARVLAVRHGAKCTVLFALGKDGAIDPDARDSLGMPEAIDSADLLVLQLRFRAWEDATMRRFVQKYLSGVPLVALRTSTHAFAYPKDSKSEFRRYSWDSREWPGGFGEQVLGETWVAHHGHHKVEATRGVIEAANASHPVLRGVADVFGDTDVYTASPPADCAVLLRGQVLKGLSPTDPPVAGKKNDPMQALAWTRERRNEDGKTNRIFVTTMGAATDLKSAGLRRLLVNAIYWGLGTDVPPAAAVDIVGEYAPTDYGFGTFQRGVRPEVYALPEPAAGEKGRDGGDKPPAEKPPAEKSPAEKSPADALRPLSFADGERIALVGGGLAVQVAEHGAFEALLHVRHPAARLVVRGFGWPGDEVGQQQRPENYTQLDDPLQVFAPDTFVCFFGNNEAFAGERGIASFRERYARWIDAHATKFAKGGKPPRFVLVSPVAHAEVASGGRDVAAYNAGVRCYADAVRDLARARGLTFADVSGGPAPDAARPHRLVRHGTLLDDADVSRVGVRLAAALAGEPSADAIRRAQDLRPAVADKEWVHANDYRMLNGWYVYGGRRTHDTETFPAEFQKIRAMVAARDHHIWALARGDASQGPDDSATGNLRSPETAFGTNKYAEPKELHYATAAESAAAMRVPAGFAVEPFADEAKFAALAKPVQLNFDDRGRLWVACMPTYPQWRPGDDKPADRLLIFEDDDRDGRADRVKVFYDKLHCPTGFEFWNGGVLVTSQPRLLFLQDTDGDDRADVVETVLDGFASDDTHHAIGAFEWSPGGLLHMLEGVHMSTTVETPFGVVRNQGPAGCWVLDPARLHLRYFQTPGYGNPWCYVFDQHGRGIVGDGTTGQQHFDTLLSGAQFAGRGAPATVYDNKGMRPVVGSEFLHSRHLPDDVQGQMIYACVINMHGLTRFAVRDDGGGLGGERIADLLASDDGMFRPADPQIGPDGAVWFLDWCTPLIGHMQYSQRDPNRDKKHGRVFRLVAQGRPLLAPVTQHGKAIAEVVAQLREPEPRTRYRARRWLRAQPAAAVLAALRSSLDGIDAGDPAREQLWTEALWVQQGHGRVDAALLQSCLAAKSPHARAAAVHVVGDLHGSMADPLGPLARAASDPHPLVRVEALRGLSFLSSRAAVTAALAVTEQPMDKWLDYALDACLSALAEVWQPLVVDGEDLAPAGTPAAERLRAHAVLERADKAALQAMRTANDRRAPAAQRKAAMAELGRLPGNKARGREVFGRVCVACHRVGNQGIAVGPDIDGLGQRMPVEEIVESIFDPNAKIEPRYALVSVGLKSGEALAGFVDAETTEVLTLRLPDGSQRAVPLADVGRRDVLATSTMPEGLTQTLSAKELVDLVEYLQGLK